VSVAAQTVTLDAAAADPRKDIIVVDDQGAATVVTGTPASPQPAGEVRSDTYAPAPPDGASVSGVVVAEVWVPGGASDITSTDIRDRRLPFGAVANAGVWGDSDGDGTYTLPDSAAGISVPYATANGQHLTVFEDQTGLRNLKKGILGTSQGGNGLRVYPSKKRAIAADGFGPEVYAWKWPRDDSIAGVELVNSVQVPNFSGSGACAMYKPDGTKCYLAGLDDTVKEYDLSTPYDISTASLNGTGTINYGHVESTMWKPDGTRFYAYDETTYLDQYDVSTPWDITTLNNRQRLTIDSSYEGTGGFVVDDDGQTLYFCDGADNQVHHFTVGTAWDFTTASHFTTRDVPMEFNGHLEFVNDYWGLYLSGGLRQFRGGESVVL